MSNGLIIIVLFFLVLTWMLIALIRNVQAISKWKMVYPESTDLEVQNFQVAPEWVSQKTASELVKEALSGNLKEALSSHFLLANTRITLIKDKLETTAVYQQLLDTVNSYLVKVGASSPDYNLIKDLCLDAELKVLKRPVLPGFFLTGIGGAGGLLMLCVGFFFLSGDGSLTNLYFAVSLSLGLAALGALLDVWFRHFFYPGIHFSVEQGRRKFLFFIESELLPISNEGITEVLEKMQQNFEYFNTSFRSNINDFQGLMGNLQTNVKLETELIQELSKLNLEEVANTNAHIFKKLDEVMGEFDQFIQIVERMNENASHSVNLSKSLGTLTKEAEQINLSIGRIAQDVDNKLHVSTEMIRFLKRHFTELDDRKAIITRAVINFDDFIKKSFDQLERHAMERVLALKDLKIREEHQLIEALKEQKGGLNQLNNLEAILQEMQTMNARISDLSARD